jgi:predicted ester cyclase
VGGPDLIKDRAAFIAQVQGFGKLLPDLAFEIQEVITTEDRIVVRSVASGTPTADFFGVPHGGRSFRVMTIDLHTVSGGRLTTAHHVEDWATAMRQLAGR